MHLELVLNDVIKLVKDGVKARLGKDVKDSNSLIEKLKPSQIK